MKKWLLTVLFGSALVLGACGGGGDDGATDDSADNGSNGTEESADEGGGTVDSAAAEEIYQSNCATCHGADLSGGAGADLTSVGADHSSDEIKDIITNGTDGGMPAFGSQLSEGDIQTLASWLAQKK
ncbi:c-type cytochrome [Virgibacillus doumboii]|uniref:c-type cytochrome n=1 Tax=Virgibacillus doumboii TaxID=2697503 RepID=UPI0013E077ED|nr:cytochrome c [Virgibacillus doumboii]